MLVICLISDLKKLTSKTSRCHNQLKQNWLNNCHSALHLIHAFQTPTKHATALSHSLTSIDVKNCVERITNHATISRRFSIISVQMHGLKNGKINWPTALSQSNYKLYDKHRIISIAKTSLFAPKNNIRRMMYLLQLEEYY